MRTAGIRWTDTALTGALLAGSLFVVLVLPKHWLDGRPVDAVGVILIVLATLPVLVRRRFPVSALAACAPVEIVYHAMDYAHEVSLPVAVVLIYTVSVRTSRLSALVTVVMTGLTVLLTIGLTQDGPPGSEAISPLGWFLVALVTGQAVRLHRAYLTEATERRVVEERLRIARDLHDVLAHNIVVINSHAAVAAHLLDERADDPSLAPIAASLHTVADASSGVLSELRTTLDLLRGNDVDAEWKPAPGLDQLAELASTTDAAGVSVSVDVAGSPRRVGSGVEVTLYRIAQEALTNVVKHADARSAWVRLSYGDDEVRLEITDDGHGVTGPQEHGGYGIVGMVERAHALGGRLEVGNGPEGGFRVVATVPANKDRNDGTGGRQRVGDA